MEYITEMQSISKVEVWELYQYAGKVVKISGIIHKIREMSGFAFVILRTRRELLQCVYTADRARFGLNTVVEGCAVIVEGEVVLDSRVTNGAEVHIVNIEVLSKPAEGLPIVINKKKLDISLDTNLTYRPISLRNPHERAIFKVQEGIARGFREYLLKQNFTEIRTPKIVFAGAEGGANIFKLDYFGKQVYLAQSPQFYKQTMVGVFERVFEVAPVYRAEKHNTSRHLNEYVSLDFEMGFINEFTEIMQMETGVLKYVFYLLEAEYSNELVLLNVKVPKIESIPAVKFMDAKNIIATEYKRKITDYHDFEPEEEQLLCEYAKKKLNSDFIFVTHYPSSKRPFYAMDDKNDPYYMEKLHLKNAGFLTNAAMLLFSADPEKWLLGAYTKIGYFESDADLLYQDEIHGSILDQVDKIVELVYLKYMKAKISYEGMQRIERYFVPEEALREALLNAIIHKQYEKGIPIQISVYEDRLYIANCGQLPESWTVENLMAKHASQPFNPHIAHVFYLAGFIESWGRGIEKICDACRKDGVPQPEYTIHPGDIMIQFTALQERPKEVRGQM